MPKVKVQSGKLIVCCGDDDCIEIDTSTAPPSSGGSGTAPPYEPPLSGGIALFAPSRKLERLTLTRNTTAAEYWSGVANIEKRSESYRANTELDFTVQLVLPHGSRLRLAALQALAKRLRANVEVHFAPAD